MTTTRGTIGLWYDRGVKENKDYMIVVCDTFDHVDYPVYASERDFWETHDEYNGKNMQRIMEVYDLNGDREAQLSAGRVHNTPTKIRDTSETKIEGNVDSLTQTHDVLSQLYDILEEILDPSSQDIFLSQSEEVIKLRLHEDYCMRISVREVIDGWHYWTFKFNLEDQVEIRNVFSYAAWDNKMSHVVRAIGEWIGGVQLVRKYKGQD